jgi:squalene synthase HpnC
VGSVESANRHSGTLVEVGDLSAKARSENFTVASRLLPAHVRADLVAIYGFARLTDDIGDEAEGDRLRLLDWLEEELDKAAQGEASHPVLQQLTPVIRRSGLGLEPFRRLIEANRIDQLVTRYETFDDLLGYCSLSAAPVGRLVLDVLRLSTPWRVALSDDVCAGLQVVEHIQDVGEDARRGRIYLPLEDLRRFGCSEDDLGEATSSPALRRLVAYEAWRASELLRSGAELARTLPMRARVAVCGFVAGGEAALDAVRRAGNDVLAHHCRPRRTTVARRTITAFGAASAYSAPRQS